MTYTMKIKEEILERDMREDYSIISEVYGIISSRNSIKKEKIEIQLESHILAQYVVDTINKVTTLKTNVKFTISKKLGEHKVYTITIPKQPGYKEFVNEIQLSKDKVLKDKKEFKGFIRGVFLSCGYIKDPEKEYALDFFIDSVEIGELLYEGLLSMEKKVFKTSKRKKQLIYIRNAEDILDILIEVGVLKEFFNYEETIMMKEIKNKTIREINWEVANETKALNTGQKHVKMIKYIDDIIGIDTLTLPLQEVAQLRLRNSESTLTELANMIGLSKSGIRNRFRRLEKIYNDLREEEKGESGEDESSK